MRDVAKCAGHKCTLRDGCDRFVRPATGMQTWVEPEWLTAAIIHGQRVDVCRNFVPLAVQPHGGAREEGDGA